MNKSLFFGLILISCLLFNGGIKAQKIDSIYFNLYVDSLKLGIHNYINVDGKLSDGRFIPLDSKQINFSSNYGRWENNSLIIDSSYKKDSIVIQAALKDQPEIKRIVTVYIKKYFADVHLPTTEELIERWRKEAKKPKKKN